MQGIPKWLRKRGYLRDDADVSNESPRRTFEEALILAAMERGTLKAMRDDGVNSAYELRPPAKSDAVTHHGFNLHASVTIRADDDMGRERLFRYGLRPAFALSRLRFLRDGNLAYRVEKAGRRLAKSHRVMTPVECLARLCALIPPPRYPLTRFHGVLAPRAKLRRLVVPRPPAPRATCTPRKPGESSSAPEGTRRDVPIFPASPIVSDHTLARVDLADVVAPNILSVEHMERIGGGLLHAASSKIPWATLPHRTFDTDITSCARCGGHVRVRAVVTDHETAARILDAIARRRARDPTSPRAA